MDTYGTCQLGNTCDRQLYLLACRHNQVAKLVDNHYDVGHVLMSVFGIQLTFDELLVVLLDVSGLSHLQQVVTGVHLLTE